MCRATAARAATSKPTACWKCSRHPMAGRPYVRLADLDHVDGHADQVAAQAGSIDVCCNLISHGDVQGTPLAELSLADFERPVTAAVRWRCFGGVAEDARIMTR